MNRQTVEIPTAQRSAIFLFLRRVMQVASSPASGNSNAIYGDAGVRNCSGVSAATCPLPEVSTVKATPPDCVMVAGMKTALALGGSPVAVNVIVPTEGAVASVALKAKVAEVPAVTETFAFEFGRTATRAMAVESAMELLALLASPIPPTLGLLMTVAGASEATFTVITSAG